nr:hypothetical protein [Tanacetum cinerariifolium]
VESSRDEEGLGEDASKQGRRIDAIDADEEITMKNENVVEEVVDVAQVSTTATTITITTEEITLAQALKALKTSKPKVKGIVFQEPSESTTTTISSKQSHDKGKRIIIEKPVKPKKKDQIRLDEETAKRLQAKFDKEERLTRKKAKKEQEANIALTETWDDIQAKINNIEGYKLQDLKLKEFDSIKEMFEKAFTRLNTFKDFRTELVQGKEKRAGEELIQESTKNQKVEDDKETSELKLLMEIIPNKEEVAIDDKPLVVKSPKIVDWKIYKEGKKIYYQIMRVDGKSQMYMVFSKILKSFNREYLEHLYKLVKAKFKSTRPVEDLDLLL